MEKLISEDEFNEMIEYHKQMGGYDFYNSIDNISIEIKCHHRDGNKVELYNDENDESDYFTFGFEGLTFKKFESYIEELQQKLINLKAE